jgi:hypothetical protein
MPRRSALRAAAPRELSKAISEIEQRIAKAVKEAGLIDRNTGKPIEGDCIAALARIGHDPKVREADRIKALSILLDRTSPSVKPEPAQITQATEIKINFQPIGDENPASVVVEAPYKRIE